MPSHLGSAAAALAAVAVYLRSDFRDRRAARGFCVRYRELMRLSRRIADRGEGSEVIQDVLRSAVDLLDLKNAEVEVRTGRDSLKVVVRPGERGGRIHPVDLSYRGRSHGRLVAYTDERRSLTSLDQLLLEEFAREIAASIHAFRVAGTLQEQSRTVAVARSEVCHRIQRDLHDGLGPVLAAVKMQIDSARALLPTDADAADALLEQVGAETQNAVADVRRLVSELRLPSGAGLADALRKQARRFERASAGRLRVRLEMSADSLHLSGRAELAAYRIASEALTNIAKHARAQNCVIRVTSGRDLRMEIIDDGIGIPTRRRNGQGLTSMRERARELGGECVIARRPTGGTRVSVRLPLERS